MYIKDGQNYAGDSVIAIAAAASDARPYVVGEIRNALPFDIMDITLSPISYCYCFMYTVGSILINKYQTEANKI